MIEETSLRFIFGKDAEQSFCSRKKEILQRWGCNISFLLLNILRQHILQTDCVKGNLRCCLWCQFFHCQGAAIQLQLVHQTTEHIGGSCCDGFRMGILSNQLQCQNDC